MSVACGNINEGNNFMDKRQMSFAPSLASHLHLDIHTHTPILVYIHIYIQMRLHLGQANRYKGMDEIWEKFN